MFKKKAGGNLPGSFLDAHSVDVCCAVVDLVHQLLRGVQAPEPLLRDQQHLPDDRRGVLPRSVLSVEKRKQMVWATSGPFTSLFYPSASSSFLPRLFDGQEGQKMAILKGLLGSHGRFVGRFGLPRQEEIPTIWCKTLH